jgi:thiol:disulfide interchange protein DsbD
MRALAIAAVALSAAASSGSEPIRWRTDRAAALSESRETGKPLLIDFTASWCSACRMMQRHSWSDPRVAQEVAEHYIPLALDLSDDEDGAGPLSREYGVSSLPMVLQVRERDTLRTEGYLPPPELLTWLRGGRSKSNPPRSSQTQTSMPPRPITQI